jgi:hypothetical protein
VAREEGREEGMLWNGMEGTLQRILAPSLPTLLNPQLAFDAFALAQLPWAIWHADERMGIFGEGGRGKGTGKIH